MERRGERRKWEEEGWTYPRQSTKWIESKKKGRQPNATFHLVCDLFQLAVPSFKENILLRWEDAFASTGMTTTGVCFSSWVGCANVWDGSGHELRNWAPSSLDKFGNSFLLPFPSMSTVARPKAAESWIKRQTFAVLLDHAVVQY